MEKVFHIIAEKDNTKKLFFAKLAEFKTNKFKYVAIDLSSISIPNSTILGAIIEIIKLSMDRKGATYIYTDKDSTIELFNSVHISKLATVIKDKESFNKIVMGDVSGYPEDKSKNWPSKKTTKSHNNQNKKMPVSTLILSLTNIITVAILIFFAIIYSRDKLIITKTIEELVTQTAAVNKLQTQIKPLSDRISELELLNEISQ